MNEESSKSFIKKLFCFEESPILYCGICKNIKPENGWAYLFSNGECYCSKECYHKSETYQKELFMWA